MDIDPVHEGPVQPADVEQGGVPREPAQPGQAAEMSPPGEPPSACGAQPATWEHIRHSHGATRALVGFAEQRASVSIPASSQYSGPSFSTDATLRQEWHRMIAQGKFSEKFVRREIAEHRAEERELYREEQRAARSVAAFWLPAPPPPQQPRERSQRRSARPGPSVPRPGRKR